MKTLKFCKEEVGLLLDQLRPTDEVMLVGDDGVYLMSFSDKVPTDKRRIVYAEGCDPKKDEDWWDTKRRLFGGDDGGDVVGTAEKLYAIVDASLRWVLVGLTADQIEISNDVVAKKGAKS